MKFQEDVKKTPLFYALEKGLISIMKGNLVCLDVSCKEKPTRCSSELDHTKCMIRVDNFYLNFNFNCLSTKNTLSNLGPCYPFNISVKKYIFPHLLNFKM